MDADDAASRIAHAIGLDPDCTAQDFQLGLDHQSLAIAKLCDPSTITTLHALAEVWRASPESILCESIRVFSATRPDERFSGSEIAL